MGEKKKEKKIKKKGKSGKTIEKKVKIEEKED